MLTLQEGAAELSGCDAPVPSSHVWQPRVQMLLSPLPGPPGAHEVPDTTGALRQS